MALQATPACFLSISPEGEWCPGEVELDWHMLFSCVVQHFLLNMTVTLFFNTWYCFCPRWIRICPSSSLSVYLMSCHLVSLCLSCSWRECPCRAAAGQEPDSSPQLPSPVFCSCSALSEWSLQSECAISCCQDWPMLSPTYGQTGFGSSSWYIAQTLKNIITGQIFSIL